MAFFAVSWREPARIADLIRRVFGLIGVVGWGVVFIVLFSLRATTLTRRQVGAVRAAGPLARACFAPPKKIQLFRRRAGRRTMTHLLTPVLTLLSPRRPPRGPLARWATTTAIAAAAIAVTPTRAHGEPAPVSSAMSATGDPPATPPTKCEPLPPYTGDQAALMATGREMVKQGKKFEIGSPRHSDVKIELMGLLLRSGELSTCKALRTTRATRTLSSSQAHAITCMELQFCRPMPLASPCPAGMRNDGPEGCAPVRACVATADAQATACTADDATCCAAALLVREIADVEAGLPTPESLAVRRRLARTACDAGHAEICLEAAALGIGTLAAQRKRACTLGHALSCRPPKTPR